MPVMPDAAVFAACPMIKLTPQREIAPFTSRCIPTMMLGGAAVRKIRRSYPVHHVQRSRILLSASRALHTRSNETIKPTPQKSSNRFENLDIGRV
jgi:hypothetical protein